MLTGLAIGLLGVGVYYLGLLVGWRIGFSAAIQEVRAYNERRKI
jgi:hypothetical protein